MKYDANQLKDQSQITANVCIVGSGAAGITLARELRHSGLSVVLLEGGGAEASDESQALYEAAEVTSGPVESDYDQSYAGWSRLRYMGGSTNHWGGWCRPLDEVDFEMRPWVPMSGWPFSRRVLENDYKTAAEIVEIDAFDFENENRDPREGRHPVVPDFDYRQSDPEVWTRYFHYSPPTRFAEKYGPELEAADNIKIYLNANVTQFQMEPGTETVSKAVVKNYAGAEISVHADLFVLACGGIENPRLLLNSEANGSGAFGNQNDLVGRYFMDHPHVSFGFMLNHFDPVWTQPYRGDGPLSPKRLFGSTKSFQAREQVLNFSCSLGKMAKLPEGSETISPLLEFDGEATADENNVHLFIRTEMEPRFNNRIALSNQRDALGVPQLTMNIEYSELDRNTFQKSTEAVIRFLSSQGRGRGRLNVDSPFDWPKKIGGGCHHIGTTRMSNDPRHGVVDENCQVHGTKNLFVAGSSVFPTGGYANPTLTIVALALKLSRHIMKVGV